MVLCSGCRGLIERGEWELHARCCTGWEPEKLKAWQAKCATLDKGHRFIATEKKGSICMKCCAPNPAAAGLTTFVVITREVFTYQYRVQADSKAEAIRRMEEYLHRRDGTTNPLVNAGDEIDHDHKIVEVKPG